MVQKISICIFILTLHVIINIIVLDFTKKNNTVHLLSKKIKNQFLKQATPEIRYGILLAANRTSKSMHLYICTSIYICIYAHTTGLHKYKETCVYTFKVHENAVLSAPGFTLADDDCGHYLFTKIGLSLFHGSHYHVADAAEGRRLSRPLIPLTEIM